MASKKSARHRAKLRAKHRKVRLRRSGYLRKRKSGGRMKMLKRHGKRQSF